MRIRKRNVVRENTRNSVRSMPRQRAPLSLTVSTRRQTNESSHIYNTALDAVLAEWVRQHLGPEGKPS